MRVEEKLYLLSYVRDEQAHIKVDKDQVCLEQCRDKPCTFLCPANVYVWEKDHIAVSYDNCVECGGCQIICPFDNIRCTVPRGGYGVKYKYG